MQSNNDCFAAFVSIVHFVNDFEAWMMGHCLTASSPREVTVWMCGNCVAYSRMLFYRISSKRSAYNPHIVQLLEIIHSKGKNIFCYCTILTDTITCKTGVSTLKTTCSKPC